MFFNHVTMVGEILTEPSTRQAKRAKGEKPMPVLDFKLLVLRRSFSKERLTIRVVLFAGAAETFTKYGKKKGDHVLISGRLCVRTFPGKEGGTIEHHYVVAEDFRFLWGPPGKFVRGHALVPKAEYERFKRLEAECGGRFHVPDDLQEDPAGEGDDPALAGTKLEAGRFGYDSHEDRGRAAGWGPD